MKHGKVKTASQNNVIRRLVAALAAVAMLAVGLVVLPRVAKAQTGAGTGDGVERNLDVFGTDGRFKQNSFSEMYLCRDLCRENTANYDLEPSQMKPGDAEEYKNELKDVVHDAVKVEQIGKEKADFTQEWKITFDRYGLNKEAYTDGVFTKWDYTQNPWYNIILSKDLSVLNNTFHVHIQSQPEVVAHDPSEDATGHDHDIDVGHSLWRKTYYSNSVPLKDAKWETPQTLGSKISTAWLDTNESKIAGGGWEYEGGGDISAIDQSTHWYGWKRNKNDEANKKGWNIIQPNAGSRLAITLNNANIGKTYSAWQRVVTFTFTTKRNPYFATNVKDRSNRQITFVAGHLKSYQGNGNYLRTDMRYAYTNRASDLDGDNVSDYLEPLLCSNPITSDSDGDDRTDGQEITDIQTKDPTPQYDAETGMWKIRGSNPDVGIQPYPEDRVTGIAGEKIHGQTRQRDYPNDIGNAPVMTEALWVVRNGRAMFPIAETKTKDDGSYVLTIGKIFERMGAGSLNKYGNNIKLNESGEPKLVDWKTSMWPNVAVQQSGEDYRRQPGDTLQMQAWSDGWTLCPLFTNPEMSDPARSDNRDPNGGAPHVVSPADKFKPVTPGSGSHSDNHDGDGPLHHEAQPYEPGYKPGSHPQIVIDNRVPVDNYGVSVTGQEKKQIKQALMKNETFASLVNSENDIQVQTDGGAKVTYKDGEMGTFTYRQLTKPKPKLSATQSTLQVSYSGKVGNQATITYTPKDQNGMPFMTNGPVKVTVLGNGSNSADGTHEAMLTKSSDGKTWTGETTITKAGSIVPVTSMVNNVAGPSAIYTATAGDPATATINGTQETVTSGVQVDSSHSGTITVKDKFGNPVADNTPVWVKSPGDNTSKKVMTGSNGTVAVQAFTPGKVSDNKIQVFKDSDGSVNSRQKLGEKTLTVTPADPNANQTTLTLIPDEPTNDGSNSPVEHTQVDVESVVKDKHGNLVTNHDMTLVVATGNGKKQFIQVKTNDKGKVVNRSNETPVEVTVGNAGQTTKVDLYDGNVTEDMLSSKLVLKTAQTTAGQNADVANTPIFTGASASSVVVSLNNQLANGVAQDKLTVTLKNAYGSVVKGKKAFIQVAPVADVKVGEVVDNNDGTYTVPLTSTKANTYSVNVNYTGATSASTALGSASTTPGADPDKADTPVFSPSSFLAPALFAPMSYRVASAPATYGAMAERGARGVQGAPGEASPASPASSPTLIPGSPLSVTFVAGTPAHATGDEISVIKDSQVTGRKVSVTDATSNKVTKGNVYVKVPGNSSYQQVPVNSDGTATIPNFTATDNTSVKIYSDAQGHSEIGTVNVSTHVGPVDVSHSRVEVVDNSKVADGSQQDSYKVTLKDANDNSVVGMSDSIKSEISGISGTSLNRPMDNGNGTYTVMVSSTKAGTASVTVKFKTSPSEDGTQLSGSPLSLKFVPGEPAHAKLYDSNQQKVADSQQISGQKNTQISTPGKLLVTDKTGNPVAEHTHVYLMLPGESAVRDVQVGAHGLVGIPSFTPSGNSSVDVFKEMGKTTQLGSVPVTVFVGDADLSTSAHSNYKVMLTQSGKNVANGVDSYTVTITLKDSSNNPVSGQAANLSIEQAGIESGKVTISLVSDQGSTGVYTAMVKSTKSGTGNVTVSLMQKDMKKSVLLAAHASKSVMFVPGEPASVMFTGVPDNVTSGMQYCKSSSCSITVKDANGNLVSGNVKVFVTLPGSSTPQPVVVSGDAGVAILPQFTPGKVADNKVTVYKAKPGQADMADTSSSGKLGEKQLTVNPGPASNTTSTLTLSPSSSPTAFETVLISGVVKDAASNPLKNHEVTLKLPDTMGVLQASTDDNGNLIPKTPSTTLQFKAGLPDVQQTVEMHDGTMVTGMLLNSASVTPVANPEESGKPYVHDGEYSTATITHGSKLADGKEYHTVTVVLKDVYGKPVSGVAGKLSLDTSTTVLKSALMFSGFMEAPERSGVYTSTVKSTQPGTPVLNVAYERGASGKQVTIASDLQATFVAGDYDPSHSSLTVTKGQDAVDTSHPVVAGSVVKVVFTPRDAQDHVLTTLSGPVTVTVPGITQPVQLSKQSDGMFTNESVKLTKAGSYDLTSMVTASASKPAAAGPKATVKVTDAGAHTASGEVIDAVKGSTVRGKTVTVTDEFGNPVKSGSVYVKLPGSSSYVSVPVHDGVAIIPDFTAGNSGKVLVAKDQNGSMQLGSVTVTTHSGAYSKDHSELTLTTGEEHTPVPSSGVAAGSVVTVTFTPKDEYGNVTAVPDGTTVSVQLTLPDKSMQTVKVTAKGGVYTGVFTPQKSGAYQATVKLTPKQGAASDGPSKSLTVLPALPNAVQSSLKASADNPVSATDTKPIEHTNVTVTGVVKDAYGNTIPTRKMSLVVAEPDGSKRVIPVTTNGQGELVDVTTSMPVKVMVGDAGKTTRVDLYDGTITDPNKIPASKKPLNSVSVTAGKDPSKVNVPVFQGKFAAHAEVTPGHVLADGHEHHTVTVVLKDTYGSPVTGAESKLSLVKVDGINVSLGAFTPKAHTLGSYEAPVTSMVVGKAYVNATYTPMSGGAVVIPERRLQTWFMVGQLDASTTEVKVTREGGQDAVHLVTAGDMVTVSVSPKDAQGHARALPGNPATIQVRVPGVSGMVTLTRDSHGVYVGQATPVTATTASTNQVSFPEDSPLKDKHYQLDVMPGSVDSTNTTLNLTPEHPASPGSTTPIEHTNVIVDATVKDSHNNPIPGHDMTLVVTDGEGHKVFVPVTTDAKGQVVKKSDNKPVKVAVGAAGTTTTVDLYDGNVTESTLKPSVKPVKSVTVEAGENPAMSGVPVFESDKSKSFVAIDNNNVVVAKSDGSHTVTVTLKDMYGKAVKGKSAMIHPSVQAGEKGVTFGKVTDNNDGTYTFTVSSSTPSPAHVTVKYGKTVDNGMVIPGSPVTANFGAGAYDKAKSTLVINHNGTVGSTDTITFTPKDKYGNPTTLPGGAKVTVTVPDNSDKGSHEVTLTKDTDGTYTGTTKVTKAGSSVPVTSKVTVPAAGAGSQSSTEDGPSTTYTATAGAISKDNSVVTVSKQGSSDDVSTVAAGTSVVVSVTPKDEFGNVVTDPYTAKPGADAITVSVPGVEGNVTLTRQGNSAAYSATVTPVKAVKNGKVTVVGGALNGKTHDLTVTAGAFDKDNSTLTVTTEDGKPLPKDGIETGTPVVIVFTPKDKNGNAIDATTVTVKIPGTDKPVVLVRQDDGSYKGTFTPKVPGTTTFTPVVTLPGGTQVEGNPVTVTVRPQAPVVDSVNNHGVSGKVGKDVSAGSTVTARDENGNVIGKGTVKDDGSFTITYDEGKTPADGTKVTVTVTDKKSGTTSHASKPVVAKTTNPKLDLNKSDGTSVSGTTTPGSTVTVTYTDDNGVKHTVTGKADKDGKFTIKLPTPAAGSTNITVTVTDPNGNTVTKTVVSDRSNTIGSVSVSNDGTKVTVVTDPFSKVVITDDKGNVIASGTADENGKVTITVPQLKSGSTITVVSTDPAGNKATKTVTYVHDLPKPKVKKVTHTEISGTAQPGTEIHVMVDGSKDTHVVKVKSDGSFVVKFGDGTQLKEGDVIHVFVVDPKTQGKSAEYTQKLHFVKVVVPVQKPTQNLAATGSPILQIAALGSFLALAAGVTLATKRRKQR